MTIRQWDDRVRATGVSHAVSEATYTTIATITTAKYGSNAVLGLRAKAVYRNVGGNTGYGGYAESVGVWDDANQVIGASQPGNGVATTGHVGSVGGLTLIVVKFVTSGADILVQVSGLDTDSYKWFVIVEITAYETA
jgi:hypothetical protein